jgi:SOS response regulatory protein OraA/RecX
VAGEDAVELALRALRHRERSSRQIENHLAERGMDEHDRAAAIEMLRRTGLVDDRRFADARAVALARKGAGDALIRHDLGAAGVDRETVEAAVACLDDETSRARRVVERRGVGASTVRYLVGKGFPPDVAHGVVAEARADALG